MIFHSGVVSSRSAARRAALLLTAVAISLLSVGAVAADTVPPLDRERPTLRLWHIPLEHDYNPFSKANRGVFDYYRKTHPEVRLVPTTQITIGGDVLEAQFLMAMAGGTAPDVISNVPVRTFRGYLEKGFFHPLDEFLSQQEIDRLNPELLKVLSRDGKIYGLPIEDYAHCLFYRRADFAAVGLDPRRPPRTSSICTSKRRCNNSGVVSNAAAISCIVQPISARSFSLTSSMSFFGRAMITETSPTPL